MAIFLLKAQAVSRSSKGYTNMLDVASYRSEENFEKESFIQKVFQKKERCLASGIELPAEADESIRDRKTLWQKVEKSETRKNSRLAREFVLGLPKELNLKAHKKLVKKFTTDLNRKGLVCDWNIHKSKSNPHAHILTTTRKIEGNKFTTKQREWDKKEFLARVKNVWQGILNEQLHKKKIVLVNQIKKDPETKSLNLKPREYHLYKRLVKEWLNKPEKIAIIYNKKESKYFANISFELPAIKTKRVERKFFDVCIDIAKKEHKKEFKIFSEVYNYKKKVAEEKTLELQRRRANETYELEQKKNLELYKILRVKAKKLLLENIKKNALEIDKSGIRYNSYKTDEKTLEYLKKGGIPNIRQLLLEIKHDVPKISEKVDKKLQLIQQLTQKRGLTR